MCGGMDKVWCDNCWKLVFIAKTPEVNLGHSM